VNNLYLLYLTEVNNKYTLISSNDSTKEKKTNNQSKINKSKRVTAENTE
ncbi:19095_t:CDS:2, partial [Entrophospora sp. SA101]